jgi:hypothetical protein
MKVTINHKKTQADAIQLVDKGANGLFAGAAGSAVEITDPTREWVGPVMHFSFTARFGFIAMPLNGTIDVSADNTAVVECELPSMVDKFLGDGKVQSVIEKKVQLLLE